jgi:chromosome segregation ATPase
MSKRAGRDTRTEPGEEPGAEDASRFRVDRVFAAPRPQRAPASTPNHPPIAPNPAPMAQPEGSRPLPPTPTAEAADGELALRRQLSRLQRQLADAQRELANKEEELASEAQMKLGLTLARDALLEDQRVMRMHLDELAEQAADYGSVEQRFSAALAELDEQARVLELERTQHATARKSIEELMRALEEERARGIDARNMLEDRHAEEIAQVEHQKKSAIAAAEASLAEITSRLRESHQAELAETKSGHEREMAAVRGELEPKVVEARTLAEERERLSSEVSALRSEAARDAADFEQTLRREIAQLEEAHLAELAARMRAHAAELNRALGERDSEIFSHQQTVRNGELREQQWEQKLAAAKEAQKKAEIKASELDEKAQMLELERVSFDQRLAAAQRTADELAQEKRILQQQLDSALAEARRNELDRTRFVAYLEEGLAMLGALPPAPEEPSKAAAPAPEPAAPEERKTATHEAVEGS